MTQEERLDCLLRYLLAEREEYKALAVPAGPAERRRLLRALLNVRPPEPLDRGFYQVQDAYLQEELRRKGVTRLDDLCPVRPGLYLWQGDITTLAVDAIVNAANSAMLGCFIPCHGCVDNAIHTAAGFQLRRECARMMALQPGEEPPGRAKITNAYNLPCRYVLHTVGPIVRGRVTRRDREELASCYRACLELAAERGLHSVAFCCISTGEFRFPNREAAQIAVDTVKECLRRKTSIRRVIFNVFKDLDAEIYRGLLGPDRGAETGP